MATRLVAATDAPPQAERPRKDRQELGAAELQNLLLAIPGAASSAGHARPERLHRGVYRLWMEGGHGPVRSLVVKRLPPDVAQADRLVAERWLPALGLGDRCPCLLAAVAQREGRWVWHAYEDLSGDTLAQRRDRPALEAAINLVAALHTRGAAHPLLPEVRWHARDHGASALTSSLRDGIAALEALSEARVAASPALAAVHSRLLGRLHGLLEAAPARAQIMEEVGGPDTLLHGDLWPKNVFVTPAESTVQARLIDWDHVGVGPSSYDVSTFLYQSRPAERPWLLRRYRDAVERAGYRLPTDGELNQLFYTAETARFASCVIWPALAVLNDGAEWGGSELVEVDRWLANLRPPLDP